MHFCYIFKLENTLIWQPWNKHWVTIGSSIFKFNLDFHSTRTPLSMCDQINFNSKSSVLSFLPPVKKFENNHKVSCGKDLMNIICDPDEIPFDNPEINAIQALLIMHSDALEIGKEQRMPNTMSSLGVESKSEILFPNNNEVNELKKFNIDSSMLVPPNATVWLPFRIYIKYAPHSNSAVDRPLDNRSPLPCLGPQEVRELEALYIKASNKRKEIIVDNKSMEVEEIEASMSAILRQREKV